jgi:hypothetical protein
MVDNRCALQFRNWSQIYNRLVTSHASRGNMCTLHTLSCLSLLKLSYSPVRTWPVEKGSATSTKSFVKLCLGTSHIATFIEANICTQNATEVHCESLLSLRPQAIKLQAQGFLSDNWSCFPSLLVVKVSERGYSFDGPGHSLPRC